MTRRDYWNPQEIIALQTPDPGRKLYEKLGMKGIDTSITQVGWLTGGGAGSRGRPPPMTCPQ